MFKAINPDALLALSLEKVNEPQPPSQRFRIVRIASSDGDNQVLVWIEADGRSESHTISPLREVAAEYLVAITASEWKMLNPPGAILRLARQLLGGHFRSGTKHPPEYRMLLRDYLNRRVSLLKGTCPVSAERQTAVLSAWLLTTGANSEAGIARDRWLDSARAWIRLEEVRGAASPATTVTEFFVQLRRLLDLDQQFWQPRPTSGPRKTLVKTPAIQAKPASLLAELYRARARACNVSASGGGGLVDFRPYLEQALLNYWARLLDESPLLKEISGSTDALRIDAHVVDCGLVPAARPDHRHVNVSYAEGRVSIELAILYRVLLGNYGSPRNFAVQLSIHCAQVGPPIRRPPRAFRQRLASHMGDIQWALREYFQQHGCRVSATERLAFRNSRDFEAWLPRAHDAVAEARLRELAQCLEGNGTPEFQQDDDAKPIRTIARWLTSFPMVPPTATASLRFAR